MSEEEKKIINRINRSYDDNTQYVEASAKDWNYIVHLIRKLHEEIEELKEKNTQLTNYLNDSYYVSADKIREKINELETLYNCNLDTALTSYEMFVFVRSYIDKVKNILKELLH